jgi:hypothetical protein
MVDYIFRRSLHPVGHGAFFSEHISVDDKSGKSKPFLNVVYDCGASARGKNPPTRVQKEVDITFKAEDHIDLLFISHFDEDHTNGLTYLLNHTIMDSDTYAVIPFAYPYLIMVMDDRFPSLANFIQQAITKKIRLVGISSSNLEKPLENTDSVHKGTSILTLTKDNLITAWDVANKKALWYFYPFMTVDVDSLQSKFEAQVDAHGTLNGIDVNNAGEVIAHKDQLKAIYQRIGKNENGITKINVNSLLMMSFPAKDVCKSCNIYMGYGIDSDIVRYRYDEYDRFLSYMKLGAEHIGPACLYTGDSVVNQKKFDLIGRHVINLMQRLSNIARIHMMQIPHHGSWHSFSPSMMGYIKPIVWSTFLNCNPLRKVYLGYRDLIREAVHHRLPLYMVTDFFQSRIEMFVWL